jgi:hypothetical protein
VGSLTAPLGVGPGATAGWRDVVRSELSPSAEPVTVALVFDGQRSVDGERLPRVPDDAELRFDAATVWQQSIPLID